MNTTDNPAEIFWGEMAPCDHLVEVYAEEGAFLDSLTGFVTGGIRADEGVIVIASEAHRQALQKRAAAQGVDLNLARYDDQYIALDAEETLSKFLVDDWPDENRFSRLVGDLLQRAGKNGRRVRAFGEMVAILWARGQNAATVRLEHLWDELCQRKGFSLFCAYPRSGFSQNAEDSIKEICNTHSKVITNGAVLQGGILNLCAERSLKPPQGNQRFRTVVE